MRKTMAILIVMAMLLLTVGCSSKTKISCDYDINFVEYTDKPDFVEMMKGKIPLVPMEKHLNDMYSYPQDEVIESDCLITIKLNRRPKKIKLQETWLNRDGEFIGGGIGYSYTLTAAYSLNEKTILIPITRKSKYGALIQAIHPDNIIYKGFEMVVTFEDDTVEKYAFITKSEYNYE